MITRWFLCSFLCYIDKWGQLTIKITLMPATALLVAMLRMQKVIMWIIHFTASCPVSSCSFRVVTFPLRSRHQVEKNCICILDNQVASSADDLLLTFYPPSYAMKSVWNCTCTAKSIYDSGLIFTQETLKIFSKIICRQMRAHTLASQWTWPHTDLRKCKCCDVGCLISCHLLIETCCGEQRAGLARPFALRGVLWDMLRNSCPVSFITVPLIMSDLQRKEETRHDLSKAQRTHFPQ